MKHEDYYRWTLDFWLCQDMSHMNMKGKRKKNTGKSIPQRICWFINLSFFLQRDKDPKDCKSRNEKNTKD